MCEWRVAVCLEVEGSAEALLEVEVVTAHPHARLEIAATRADVVAFGAAESGESIVADGLDVELDSAAMRASVGQAARLAGSTVGEEISVADGSSDTSADNSECRSIGVDALDVVSVASVDSSCWITDREEWTGWVESNDRLNSATSHVLAGHSNDMSAQAEANEPHTVEGDE